MEPITAEACRRLLGEVEEVRRHNPGLSLLMAAEVRQLAARLDRAEAGESAWLRLQAEVWIVLAGIYRSLDDLGQTEAALNVALAFLDQQQQPASCSPTHARLACRAAYLRCDQGRTAEALALIDEAIGIHRRLGSLVASVWVDRAVILTRAGRPTAALDDLASALDTPGISAQPRTFLAAIHNMSWLLQQQASSAAETREAFDWLRLAVRLHTVVPEELSLFKLHGLLGITAFKLGAIDEATEHLWLAHSGFHRLGAAREQAGALLEIAAIELSRGAAQAVKRLAGHLFSILRHPALPRDCAAGLLLFARAAQAERATPELIRAVQARLQRWDNPS